MCAPRPERSLGQTMHGLLGPVRLFHPFVPWHTAVGSEVRAVDHHRWLLKVFPEPEELLTRAFKTAADYGCVRPPLSRLQPVRQTLVEVAVSSPSRATTACPTHRVANAPTKAPTENAPMKLGAGIPVSEYTVFLSSANDAIELRQRVDGLFHNVVQPALKSAGADIRFHLDMWEKTEPRRLEDEETIDDEFVERAVASDLLLTLIVERLGSGTRKEIEAVLASDREISLLWFVDGDEHPDTPAGNFMKQLSEEGVLRYRKAGRPGTNESWESIVTVLLAAILAGLTRDQVGGYRETR